ncbi:MAG: alkaline phosphatase D family protein [Armatimonadota bacterium]|nr:alkaline phosphatase D family protein [Armatimonadota bacterium]MDR7520135.1 alkaline phosphatase D family protein [Armatimonadota bacterium]
MGRILALTLTVLVSWAEGSAQVPSFPDGVAAGDVTQDAAVIWTRAPSAGGLRIEYSTDPGFADAQTAGPVYPDAATDYAVTVELRGLQPGRRYAYRVRAAHTIGPTGTFVTPPVPDRPASLSLVWGADTYELFRPFHIFEATRSRTPDLFLFLGDTIYADLAPVRARTLEQYRQKYRTHRDDPSLQAFLASTATWAVWDDHEVANNFDSTHPRLTIGLQAFIEAWPIRTDAADPRRLYRSVRWGRAEIFILDTRQYRSPNPSPDGPDKTMLGRTQKQWLLDGLVRSTATVKIIASSVPLRYHGRDSWEGYTAERDEILRFLRDRRIQPVVFLTGDVHYAAWIRHPEGPYEAIAGPLGAFPARAAHAAGRPGVLWAATGRNNYGWLRLTGNRIMLEWRDDQDRLMQSAHVPATP